MCDRSRRAGGADDQRCVKIKKKAAVHSKPAVDAAVGTATRAVAVFVEADKPGQAGWVPVRADVLASDAAR